MGDDWSHQVAQPIFDKANKKALAERCWISSTLSTKVPVISVNATWQLQYAQPTLAERSNRQIVNDARWLFVLSGRSGTCTVYYMVHTAGNVYQQTAEGKASTFRNAADYLIQHIMAVSDGADVKEWLELLSRYVEPLIQLTKPQELTNWDGS